VDWIIGGDGPKRLALEEMVCSLPRAPAPPVRCCLSLLLPRRRKCELIPAVRYKSQVEKHQLHDRVEFLGVVPSHKVHHRVLGRGHIEA